MNSNIVLAVLVSAIAFGTPLVLAGLGELLAERSGVLNLGVEGMMLMGAVSAFCVSQKMHGSTAVVLLLAVLAALVAGAAMALIHAFLSITIRVNQIVSGLAITIFAGIIGLSSYLGQVWNIGGLAGRHQFNGIDLFGLQNLPIVGPLIFNQDAFVYASWVLVLVVFYYLYRTRPGLYLRAVGENPSAADAMGINVTAYRYSAHTRRRSARRARGCLLHPRPRPHLDRRPHRRGRLDRHRSGHLRVLAPRPARARGLPVRHLLRPRTDTPDSPDHRAPLGVLFGAAVPDDGHRAGSSVDKLGQPSRRDADIARHPLHA